MASKPKFKIPRAGDVKESSSHEGTKFSLFRKYQQNKDIEQKPSEAKKTLTTSAASSVTRVQPVVGKLPEANTASVSSSSKTSSTSLIIATAPSTAGTSGISTTAKSSETTSGQPQTASSKPVSSNSIIVNYRQRGNPILKHIRNVPWEYGSIVPDYVMGVANCALFLSLRYHQLHPEYLHNRLKELGKGYDLRVLLVQVDVNDPHHLLRDLAKICILAELTLILAFSPEEAGRYLEAYKVYENKPAEVLMEKTETDYVSKLTECLTTVKSVNKTDSLTLLSAFKSVDGIINASKEDISLCAGFGPQKAQRLFEVFHEPFLKARKRTKPTDDAKTSSPIKKPV